MKYLIYLIIPILLCGCAVTGTRDDKRGTLSITGAGKATWPDGASIEKTPIFKWPSFSPKIIP